MLRMLRRILLMCLWMIPIFLYHSAKYLFFSKYILFLLFTIFTGGYGIEMSFPEDLSYFDIDAETNDSFESHDRVYLLIWSICVHCCFVYNVFDIDDIEQFCFIFLDMIFNIY
jgi:hypothetical protein